MPASCHSPPGLQRLHLLEDSAKGFGKTAQREETSRRFVWEGNWSQFHQPSLCSVPFLAGHWQRLRDGIGSKSTNTKQRQGSIVSRCRCRSCCRFKERGSRRERIKNKIWLSAEICCDHFRKEDIVNGWTKYEEVQKGSQVFSIAGHCIQCMLASIHSQYSDPCRMWNLC